MTTKKDMLDLTARLQMDVRDMSARLIELRAWIAASQLPEDVPKPKCPICGIARPSDQAVKEHIANVHGPATHPAEENT